MIQARTLADLDGVQHRFFTRQGGVSEGLYSSLNCGYGSDDLPDNVRENRRRAAAEFALDETDLLTVHQIHSTDVLTVGAERWTSPGAPKGDALVTDRPGVVLGVLAADCAPVLFADAEAQVIGAAHAGWKGALGGVVDTTIAAMEKLGARRERVRAAIGPCIGAASYEVGPEFPAPFLEQDEANDAFFRPARRAGHFMFDLAGYLLRRFALAVTPATTRWRRPAISSAIVATRSAAYATTAAACPPWRSGDDVPYLIILMFCCLLGVIATCAML